MASILEKAVTKAEDGTYGFQCPGIADSRCGDLDTGVAYSSTGWPERKLAIARGAQHFDDHKGTPMPSLDEFRAEHGLTVTPDQKCVRLEDI